MKIFFDLDGTLIDSRMRLYKLFIDITGRKIIDFNTYWDLKRSMQDHSNILINYLKYSGEQIKAFEEKWLSLIEDETYLNLNKPFSYTFDVLNKLKQLDCKLFVVSARQYRENTNRELLEHKLFHYFEKILITEAKKTKKELIQETFIQLNANDIIVGDTGLDINTGKELGIISIGVLSGFRNEDKLKQYSPNYLVEDIRAIPKIIRECNS